MTGQALADPPTDEQIAAFDNRELDKPMELPAGGSQLYSLECCESPDVVCEWCGASDNPDDYEDGKPAELAVSLVPTRVGVACALMCIDCVDVGAWPSWNRRLPDSTERVLAHARHVLEDVRRTEIRERADRARARRKVQTAETADGVL